MALISRLRIDVPLDDTGFWVSVRGIDALRQLRGVASKKDETLVGLAENEDARPRTVDHDVEDDREPLGDRGRIMDLEHAAEAKSSEVSVRQDDLLTGSGTALAAETNSPTVLGVGLF